MKLQEFPHVYRLPKELKHKLWMYSVKKLLGKKILHQEKEANQALRILAVSEGCIEKISNEELTWQLKLFNQSIHVATRRYPSSDLGILFQVLGKFEYQPIVDIVNTTDGYSKPLRIIDAGANVGYTSVFFKAAFPTAKILSLEVDKDNAAQIRKNIYLNGFKEIQIVQDALWKNNANLEIKRDFRDQSECSFYVEETNHDTGLKGHNLDYFLELNNWNLIDILKIDIEGAERYLFENDELADKLLNKTKLLALEIHDEFNIRESIYKHLDRNKFTYFNHGDITIAQRQNNS